MTSSGVNKRPLSTIASLATAPGVGGISVVRISGPLSLNVAKKLVGKENLKLSPRHAKYTPLVSYNNSEIDSVIITFFPSPNSFTGEDVIEISCHGGEVISNQILEACYDFGCNPAVAGEFTRRAFINGKMDLCQAEAVADVIMASSIMSKEANYRILSGRLSKMIDDLRSSLTTLVLTIEAELDFEDDEITPTQLNQKIDLISKVLTSTKKLLSTYQTGKMLSSGALVVLAGKPNAGKSSLLNAIVGEERAIVASSPGTTRDAIEVPYIINNFPVRFVDTAGIRETSSSIEEKGVGFTQNYLNKADLILNIIDASREQPPHKPFLSFENQSLVPSINVLNKADLIKSKRFSKQKGGLFTSALLGKGVNLLLEKIYEILCGQNTISSEVVLTNQRHQNSLLKFEARLSSLLDDMGSALPTDVIASELRVAISFLDELLGVTTADDILENIFANFCVGK